MHAILQALQELVRSGADDVKTAALETLGNLAFCRDNRPVVLAAAGLRDWLARLAQDKVSITQSIAPFQPMRANQMSDSARHSRHPAESHPNIQRGVWDSVQHAINSHLCENGLC